MRTIKFRGKRIDNGEWIYGNLFIPNKFVKGVYICPETSYADFYPEFSDGDSFEEVKARQDGITLGHFHEVHSESIGQFTGLLDKNGKEIYEKDIVKLSLDGDVGKVTFAGGGFYFDIDGEETEYLVGEFKQSEIEILGPTTDTPELLTVK